MKLATKNIFDYLISMGEITVPIYQRKFSWGERELSQFWDDIVSLSNEENINKHFFGIFIKKINKGLIASNTIIDGQQRLTTLIIFLIALSNLYNDNEIRKNFVFSNMYMEPTVKLILNDSQQNSLIKIINQDKNIIEKDNVISAYNFFVQKITESKLENKTLLSAIDKLEIVDITLEDNDNPQLIFDSINSLGLKLSTVEQIKNYTLMGLEPEEQQIIYNNYWLPMEQEFNKIEGESLFLRFINCYLSSQSGKNVQAPDIYIEFTKLYNLKRQFKTTEEIMSEIKKFSGYYTKLIKEEWNEEINKEVKKINNLKVIEAYPFLIEIVDDFENNLIPENLFIEMLKTTSDFMRSNILNSKIADYQELSKNIKQMIVSQNLQPNKTQPRAQVPNSIKKLIDED